MDPLTIAAIAGGALQIGQGIAQKSKAKKMARENPRPKYEISDAVLDNQALAEERASQGLSDAVLQRYREGAERGLTTSLDSILEAGGSVNNIGELYSNYGDSLSKITLLDEQMRTENIRTLMAQNQNLAEEEDKKWQVNEFAPWADTAQASSALSAQGSENMWKGLNTGLSAFANDRISGMYQDEADGVFRRNTPPARTGASSPVSSPEQMAKDMLKKKYPGLMSGNMSRRFSI